MAIALHNLSRQEFPSKVSARDLYLSLLDKPDSAQNKKQSIAFIDSSINEALDKVSEIPEDFTQLEIWLEKHNQTIGHSYQAYLDDRKAGQPRRYFTSKSHALYFIRSVAPTKMVDGSWLYGLTRYWQDQRLSSLIKIYLEELGDGEESMNHIVLYRQLLKVNECDDWKDLAEVFFSQGAIQLSLANNASEYLPEIIGFNLAYEQLPLHLLITAYELKELNIDPYYFTLHITIDNALTGHAQGAIEAVRDAIPVFGSQQEFCKRVISGSKLNDVGLSTLEIIDSFNLQDEVIRILQKKSTLGQHMHSDRCVLQGKTINQWLSDPKAISGFLTAMEESGWITRHSNPENSRFWKIISGNGAPMFGVFTKYECQVIYDWIAGNVLETLPKLKRLGKPWRAQENIPNKEEGITVFNRTQNIIEMSARKPSQAKTNLNTINKELESFVLYANSIEDINFASLLVEWMSPSKHHTPIGLWATRQFKILFNRNGMPIFGL